MTSNDKSYEDLAFLDRLSDFLGDTEEETIEEVKQSLIDEGVDPDKIIERGLRFVEEKKKSYRLRWRENAQKERERAKRILSEHNNVSDNLDGASLLDYVKQLLSYNPQFAGAFRNFEEMTEDDLRRVIRKIEILKNNKEEE
jgi:hypothetical protein